MTRTNARSRQTYVSLHFSKAHGTSNGRTSNGRTSNGRTSNGRTMIELILSEATLLVLGTDGRRRDAQVEHADYAIQFLV